MDAKMETKSSTMIVASETGSAGGDSWRVSGYLTRWGEVDSYDDITVKGAFQETIARNANGLPLLFGHQYDIPPIGLVRAMREDDRGVLFVADIAPTQLGTDIKKLVDMKAITGVSYGYNVKNSDHQTVNGKRVRRLLDVDMMEVSLTSFPALKTAQLFDQAGKDELIVATWKLCKESRIPVYRKQLNEVERAIKRINTRNLVKIAEIDQELKELDKLR